jgi:hypothetical protein
MHKMGRKFTTLLFFSIRVGAFQIDRLARLASLVLRNTKRYFGDACMKEWAGKNLSGIAKLFDGAWLGLEFARPLHGLWQTAWHGYTKLRISRAPWGQLLLSSWSCLL